MKTLKDKKIYQCEHCKKISLNAGAMKRHEEACCKNPKNIPMCDDCHWIDYPYNTNNEPLKQRFEVTFFEGTQAEHVNQYDLVVCECPFYGRLYTKLHGLLEDEVVDEGGWMKKPSKIKGCCHFLSIDVALKIIKWGNVKYENQLGFLEDFKVSPKAAFEYFTEIGDTENAKRFKPKNIESI